MQKMELLAPAGNMDKMKMALLYGADAVYLGGKAFGLRAYSGNFTDEELREAVSFAHSLKKKVHGCSIRYQYGLFNQRIVDGQQVELPDNWLVDGYPWEVKKVDKAVNVCFSGNAYMRPDGEGNLECVYENYHSVRAVPYDVPMVGYHNDTVNTLRLWRAEYTREDVYRVLAKGNRHGQNQSMVLTLPPLAVIYLKMQSEITDNGTEKI